MDVTTFLHEVYDQSLKALGISANEVTLGDSTYKDFDTLYPGATQYLGMKVTKNHYLSPKGASVYWSYPSNLNHYTSYMDISYLHNLHCPPAPSSQSSLNSQANLGWKNYVSKSFSDEDFFSAREPVSTSQSCNHEWKFYEGLTGLNTFHYCGKCDEKKT